MEPQWRRSSFNRGRESSASPQGTQGHTGQDSETHVICLVPSVSRYSGLCLPSLETRAAAAEDLIHGDGPATEENQCECESCDGQRKLETAVTAQPIVPMHFCDCHTQVDADGEGGGTGE